MTVAQKLKILKFINILLVIFLIPILLIYLLLIIPEYSACNDAMFEGEKGIDIWGSTIDCDAESRAFSEAFFQMFSMIAGGISLVMILINILYFKLKNT
ncbi:hypothetical protein [Epilithonimonas xixisoli]|uniref:Uncharacterized protein n=1 Tax=Epilithonimonas xixisoli TaxID=1476462 RepID=A0A4R8II46_9FLAO|nr:hypothetical protein [Epilithonimonas xixisoli]TDX86555.1 hypothetical protein B0I22_0689 [Epilithonimonas xixisoli]